jgi:hypothetical protein
LEAGDLLCSQTYPYSQSQQLPRAAPDDWARAHPPVNLRAFAGRRSVRDIPDIMTTNDHASDAPVMPEMSRSATDKASTPDASPLQGSSAGRSLPEDGEGAALPPLSEPPKVPIPEPSENILPTTSSAATGELEKKSRHDSVIKGTGEPDLSKVRIGDIHDNRVIDFIQGQRSDYIVYEAEGRLGYEALDTVPNRRIATDRSDELMARSELVLKGAHSASVKKLMAMALVRAFATDSESRAREAFTPVEKFIDDNVPVGSVFGRTHDYIIFMDKHGELVAECPHLPETAVPILAEFERLKQLASTNLNREDTAAAQRILGHEISSALRNTSAALTPSEAFVSSREFIGQRLGADVSNRYVFATLIAAAVIGNLLLLAVAFPVKWLADDARSLALGAFAGLLGVSISVLQRSGSLVLTQFPSKTQIVVQAIVRILLGVVFGVLVVIAVKGNVAFGTFKGEMRALFLLAVAAAFSERLIPDLLTKIGETANGSADKPVSK